MCNILFCLKNDLICIRKAETPKCWHWFSLGDKIMGDFYFLSVSAYLNFSTAAAKSLQLCLTLCDPIDSSPPGSSVHGILQARTLEWVAISSSNAWKWKVKVKSLSRVRLLATPWTVAHQAPPSMGFSRQEYWSGVPLPVKYCNGGYITLMQDDNNRRYYGGERYIGTLYFLYDVSVNCSID